MSEEDMALDPGMEGDLGDETATATGYGILNIDETLAYRSYGAWAIVACIVPPLLFNLLMRGQDIWGSVGWKFQAMVHFYLWFPVSLLFVISNAYKTKGSLSLFLWNAKLTMLGPFLLYPLACYYLFRWGTNSMWYSWFAAGMFTAYTLLSIFG